MSETGTRKLLIYQWFQQNQYSKRPSEDLDPFWELSSAQRDYIDFAFMRSKDGHFERIKNILAGKVTIKNERISPIDPYPRPRTLDLNTLKKTGSRFVQKIVQEAGWR
jgi:hypothetical protein